MRYILYLDNNANRRRSNAIRLETLCERFDTVSIKSCERITREEFSQMPFSLLLVHDSNPEKVSLEGIWWPADQPAAYLVLFSGGFDVRDDLESNQTYLPHDNIIEFVQDFLDQP